MTVHFIGAGPGAADLITLRGRDLLAACPVCLYAGSIVPPTLLRHGGIDGQVAGMQPRHVLTGLVRSNAFRLDGIE
jgi:precorrin-4/cobalt-precorrin-4 C11-methyltransferase